MVTELYRWTGLDLGHLCLIHVAHLGITQANKSDSCDLN